MTKITVDFGNDGYTIDANLQKDGNQWCILAGADLQVGIAGFGSTVPDAIYEFKTNFRNEVAESLEV